MDTPGYILSHVEPIVGARPLFRCAVQPPRPAFREGVELRRAGLDVEERRAGEHVHVRDGTVFCARSNTPIDPAGTARTLIRGMMDGVLYPSG